MVSITTKSPSERTATAICRVYFSKPQTAPLIQRNELQKGDALSVARVAGIMAAKQTPALIPLCHPIAITHAAVDLTLGTLPTGLGYVDVRATVSCVGKTGVEMEALTASSTAALTIYDMCKAVDKGMSITNLRVIEKTGGESGSWSADDQTE
jgi:cyclic pyranopterin phosphate synthase